MNDSIRPRQATIFAGFLVASGIFMLWLGTMAAAYFVPGACLLVQAILLWRGRAFRYFEGVMLVNQVTGLVLILALWLGAGLGDLKLDIAGVMLLVNLLCGGPLMSLLAIPLLGALRFGTALPGWFRSHRAAGV
jgi:hypothetical protein